MQKQLAILTMVAGLTTIAASTPARAEDLTNGLEANVPFAFTVGEKTLPAGRYEIRQVDNYGAEYMIDNMSTNKEKLFTAHLTVGERPLGDKATLDFEKVGDRYFLKDVESGPAGLEILLPESRSEARMIRDERHPQLARTLIPVDVIPVHK